MEEDLSFGASLPKGFLKYFVKVFHMKYLLGKYSWTQSGWTGLKLQFASVRRTSFLCSVTSSTSLTMWSSTPSPSPSLLSPSLSPSPLLLLLPSSSPPTSPSPGSAHHHPQGRQPGVVQVERLATKKELEKPTSASTRYMGVNVAHSISHFSWKLQQEPGFFFYSVIVDNRRWNWFDAEGPGGFLHNALQPSRHRLHQRSSCGKLS